MWPLFALQHRQHTAACHDEVEKSLVHKHCIAIQIAGNNKSAAVPLLSQQLHNLHQLFHDHICMGPQLICRQ